jgi:hypothetical protein
MNTNVRAAERRANTVEQVISSGCCDGRDGEFVAVELGSDHESLVGVGRVGWMAGVLLPNDLLPAAAGKSSSSFAHGSNVPPRNTSIGACPSLRCMTLASHSTGYWLSSSCCSLRCGIVRLIRCGGLRHAETRTAARMRPLALVPQE